MNWIYQRRSILTRWVLVLSWGSILGLLLIFLPYLRRAAELLAQRIGLRSGVADVLFWVALYGTVGWVALSLIESRLGHLKYWRHRPPLIFAGSLAIALSLLFKPLRTGVSWPSAIGCLTALLHEAVYGSIVVLFPLLASKAKKAAENRNKPVAPRKERSHQIGSSVFTDDDLSSWLEREAPITDEDEDFFELRDRIKRILEALYSRERKTVGIGGGYGTGKTSLVALIEKAAQHSDRDIGLWFAKVSCWGFRDSTAAQEAVLKQAVATMREKVDVWGIRSVPEDYIKAISSAHSAAEIILSFLRPQLEPVDHLKRLSPILDDAGARLVIVIEDVDRSGSGFDFSHIQALLYRFREVDGVSFIITADLARAAIDFTKLCDHQEDLQHLSEQLVKDIVEPLRTRLLASYPEDVEATGRSATLWPQQNTRLHWSHVFNSGYQHPTVPLTRLLGTPRTLKNSMRRLGSAWRDLHGEVDFDELLYVTALRTAAPTAFDYLLTDFADIKRLDSSNSRGNNGRGKKGHDTILAKLKDRWETVCQKSDFDELAVERIIQELLPQSSAVFGTDPFGHSQGKQKVREGGLPNYWQRIISEGLQQGEFRDQVVLRAIRKADLGQSTLSDLASQLAASDEFSDRFEHFGKGFGKLLELTESLYDRIRSQFGRHACDDAPGFAQLFRLSEGSEAFYNHPNLKDWAIGEMVKSLPLHAHLAHDIYGCWIGRKNSDLKTLRKARAAMLRTLKLGLSQVGSPSICDCLDEDDPYCLFHLLTPYDSARKKYAPHSSDRVWKWIAPHLVAACQDCPDRILPQILIVFLNPSDHAAGKDMITYNFDLKRLKSFFGSEKIKVLEAVAKGFAINTKFDRNIREQMEIAMLRARHEVSTHQISSSSRPSSASNSLSPSNLV